jgi:hypothetical protein
VCCAPVKIRKHATSESRCSLERCRTRFLGRKCTLATVDFAFEHKPKSHRSEGLRPKARMPPRNCQPPSKLCMRAERFSGAQRKSSRTHIPFTSAVWWMDLPGGRTSKTLCLGAGMRNSRVLANASTNIGRQLSSPSPPALRELASFRGSFGISGPRTTPIPGCDRESDLPSK